MSVTVNSGGSSGDWWNTTWTRRLKLTLNNSGQAGATVPVNTPDALYQLLQAWKVQLNVKPGVFLPFMHR